MPSPAHSKRRLVLLKGVDCALPAQVKILLWGLPFYNLLAVPVWSQDRDVMIAKAKEEKEFVYYSTTDIRDGTAMVHAFQKKYPFIEPKLLRLGSTQVVVKVPRNTAAARIYST